MTTRVLPRDEYERLCATPLGALALPAEARVLVVEQDGAIVGHLAVMPLWHSEALWIAPPHRKRGRVFRRLLQALGRTVADLGISTVIPGSDCAEMDKILCGLGAEPLPAMLFSLNVQECAPCQFRS